MAGRVYKFIGHEHALESLRKKRLKISRLDALNDPFEFEPFAFERPQDRQIWETTGRKIWAERGLLCFSCGWVNPVIWSHYASNHFGLCLGFDVPDNVLQMVEYVEKRDVISSLARATKEEGEILILNALSRKYQSWSYEREARIVTALDERTVENGMYFKDFDADLALTEVIIGMRSAITGDEVIEAFGQRVAVNTARLSFGDYRIVRQSNKRVQT